MMRLAPMASRLVRGVAPRTPVALRHPLLVGTTSSFSTTGGSSSPSSSTLTAATDEQPDPVHTVYVHHVTKVVSQHLQEAKADWLVQQGLDRGLRLNANGTAVLQFPSRNGFDSGRIW